MIHLIKTIAKKSYEYGQFRCNELGKKLAAQRKVNNFLDVGCGDGRFTLEFSKTVKPNEILAIEFVDEFRKDAEKKGIKCIKCDLNFKWSLGDDLFDLILSSQTIEHLYGTKIFLEECYRCLKPGGQLIVLTENLASWPNIGALFFGWQPFSTTNISGLSLGNPLIWHTDIHRDNEFMAEYLARGVSGKVDHIRVLAFCGLRDMLKRVGFSDVKVFTRGYPSFWGALADLACCIDKRHGHFLIATGFKRPIPPG